jgi:hypothetical protein
MQGTQHSETVEKQNDGKGFDTSLRMNPGLILRKEENLSSGRQIICSRETLHDFFKLLR